MDVRESSVSAVFRTFSANGISMAKAKRWLSIRSWYSFTAEESQRLAAATGVEVDALARNALTPSRIHGRTGWCIGSHTFDGDVSASRWSTRICATCVGLTGRCKVSWLVKGMCACPEHDEVLVDRCPACDQWLTWQRPAIDICRCGYFLSRAAPSACLRPLVRSWLHGVQDRLTYARGDGAAMLCTGQPAIPFEMSINAGMKLVQAFGSRAQIDESPRRSLELMKTSVGVLEVMTRGLERLATLTDGTLGWHKVAPFVHRPTIEDIQRRNFVQADARGAQTLLHELTRQSGSRRDGRGSFVRGQLSLFG